MKVIFQLALRNLKEHKAKSIIVSLFIIFGVAIVILGNSFLESINRGLEKDFRANYTGDITVSANMPDGMKADIFMATSGTFDGTLPQTPALLDIDQVEKILDESGLISGRTRMISTRGIMMKGEEIDLAALMSDDSVNIADIPVFMMFAGEEDSYFTLFGGQHIVEGSAIDYSSSENQLLIDTRIRSSFENFFKKSLNVGDSVLVMGANTDGVIREAKVVGFYTPANEYSAMFQTIYCNPSFARAFADLTYGSILDSENARNFDEKIWDVDESELFGEGDDFFDDMISDETDSFVSGGDIDFNNILGDITLRDELNRTDNGSWHFVQAKFKNGVKADNAIKELNAKFKELGIDANAMGWETAAASYTKTVAGINVFFNILVVVLAIVVFIIIMNTMTISIIERTSEIGTMRALGAEKSFVRTLFFTEASSITIVSAFIGIVLGLVIMGIFNSLNLSVGDNMIAKVILGGGQLHFSPTPAIILISFFGVAIGSLLSNIYPVSSALRITPLKALSKGGE
jgi:putative ABC transport system permease protein